MAEPGSSLEERIYRALLRSGWDEEQIAAQVPIAGGRSIRGGQVLDFVLYTPIPIPIEVNGDYWHRDSGEEFTDLVTIINIYGREPVVIWGDEAKTDDEALAVVVRKIGRRS